MRLIEGKEDGRLHVIYDIGFLDNRHHCHVSVDLVIVAGKRSPKEIAVFRTLCGTRYFVAYRWRRWRFLEHMAKRWVLRSRRWGLWRDRRGGQSLSRPW